MIKNSVSSEMIDKIKIKPTLSVNDIQNILTCGKNVAYGTVDDALKDHSFAVKKSKKNIISQQNHSGCGSTRLVLSR